MWQKLQSCAPHGNSWASLHSRDHESKNSISIKDWTDGQFNKIYNVFDDTKQWRLLLNVVITARYTIFICALQISIEKS